MMDGVNPCGTWENLNETTASLSLVLSVSSLSLLPSLRPASKPCFSVVGGSAKQLLRQRQPERKRRG